MDALNNTVILIPSLDPDEKLIGVIKALKDTGFKNIMLVNDGSKDSSLFDKAVAEFGCKLYTHCVNMGKGRALKDGLNICYNEFPDCVGVVTVDGDGQHLAKDTLRVAEAMLNNPDKLIMGCRDFEKAGIPARSRFGNVTTSRVIKLLCGIKLSDTQTGLRGISRQLIPQLVKLSGERFEYELNMILETKEQGIELLEVLIDTVYIEENASSHFNPLLDSMRIYSMFGKYIVSSLSSFVVDIALFTLLCYLFKSFSPDFAMYITVSTIGARIISAIFNFVVNRKGVFGHKGSATKSAVRYAILAILQCLCSAGFVSAFYSLLHINETVIKVVVDTVLFFISFNIQREWVFKK